MNFLMDAAKEKKSFALEDGTHVAQIRMAEVRTTQKGDEYISIALNFEDGSSYYHNLFFHSEGAIKMCAPQLKKLMLLEKLPIYASLNDLMKDLHNFVSKVESAINALAKKKIEITAETYFSKKKNEDTQTVRISGFLDTLNLAVQTQNEEQPKFNSKEEMPF